MSVSFDNSTVTQAAFSENNGVAELSITASAPLMASFSNSGRTITVSAISSGTLAGDSGGGASAVPPSGNGAPTEPENPGPGGNPTPATSASRRILVIVDPAHGGAERGAALNEGLEEKTVTLGFARLLRHELERQGFAVILLREGDNTLTLDQRAGSANTAHAGIYISLHAASQGTGARVYTALLPPEDPSKGPFRAWNVAQASALSMSQSVAAAVVNEMQRRQFPARAYSASMRPLNNLLMPAFAVELAPGPNGVADLPSANYQQRAAAAIADAVASMRDRLGAQP
jgi:N-acetylmuramoyl-L-alanine amidase